MIVIDSSIGVAKAVCVKGYFGGFHQINRQVGKLISKFNLVVNNSIRLISFRTVLMMSEHVIDYM